MATRRMVLGAGVAMAALTAAGCKPRAAETLGPLLDRLATNLLKISPETCTGLAVTEERAGGPFIGRLSDATPQALAQARKVYEDGLAELKKTVNRKRLTGQDAVSYDVIAADFEIEIAARKFETGSGATAPYVVTQLNGAYTGIPDFLDSQHPVTSRAEADAYLTRLSAYARVLDQETARIGPEAKAGACPPDFVIDSALKQLQPFAAKKPSETVLVESLVRRLKEVAAIAPADRAALASKAEAIVRDAVLPAYGRQIEALKAIRPGADHDAGCWRLPKGGDLYAAGLRYNTTTDMSPDEVHRMGLDLVASISAEIDKILRDQGLTSGTNAERIGVLSKRPDQLYPNTDAGRATLLADLNTEVAGVRALMPKYFGTLAKASLEIKRIPPYTEAGAPGGYYQQPALDGSRPGAYYINLRDTAELPKFTLPTLNHHEGIPGHHWQIAIAQEQKGLPFIRSAMLFFNAYVEGWGLYAEQLADEAGVYAANPLGRLGYLQSMIFRASRLVVDTGIHHKKWTREQAIESMMAATGDQRSNVTTEIERYAIWPGQACGYMVGRQAINRYREAAKARLGHVFDIRAFHDVVLAGGPLPLSVLEGVVKAWPAAQ